MFSGTSGALALALSFGWWYLDRVVVQIVLDFRPAFVQFPEIDRSNQNFESHYPDICNPSFEKCSLYREGQSHHTSFVETCIADSPYETWYEIFVVASFKG